MINEEDKTILLQEAEYENKLGGYQYKEHEENMRNDIDYFCEYLIDNLTIYCKKNKNIYITDMLEEINNMCIKYNQDKDYVLDYFKDI